MAMKIITCDSPHEVAKTIASHLIEAVKANPKLVLGLPTGSTPIEAYKLIGEDHKKNKTDWSKVTTFNLDEFVGLPPTHPSSYRYYMDTRVFPFINISKANTHVPSGQANPESECKRYEDAIKKAGGLDLQLVTLGGNGHIGFNEPGTPFESRTHIAELAESTIKAHASKFFKSESEVPRRAITIGIGTIMGAKKIIVPAYGKGKADAVKALIEGPQSLN